MKNKRYTREGYVFGGWYADKGTTPLTEETAAKATTSYAKFVPAYVLSVKAQIEKDAEDGEADTTYIRIVTSVDSTNYQNVSFCTIFFNAHLFGLML